MVLDISPQADNYSAAKQFLCPYRTHKWPEMPRIWHYPVQSLNSEPILWRSFRIPKWSVTCSVTSHPNVAYFHISSLHNNKITQKSLQNLRLKPPLMRKEPEYRHNHVLTRIKAHLFLMSENNHLVQPSCDKFQILAVDYRDLAPTPAMKHILLQITEWNSQSLKENSVHFSYRK